MTTLRHHLPAHELQDKTYTLLTQYARPISHIDETHENELLGYILTGEKPELLLTLHGYNNDKGTQLYGNMAKYGYHSSHNSFKKDVKKDVRVGVTARGILYNHLFERLTGEQIIRYAKSMVAITCEQTNPKFHDDVPLWFSYLISDAFRTTNSSGSLASRKSWTLANLINLLILDGHEHEQAVRIILGAFFERKGDYSYWYDDDMLHVCQLPDFDEFIADNASIATAFIPTLSVRGQTVFLAYLKPAKATAPLAMLITALALSGSKSIKELATPLLATLPDDLLGEHLSHYLINGDSKQRANSADYLARMGETARPILEQALTNEKTKSVQSAITSALSRLDTVQSVDDDDIPLETMVEPVIGTLPDQIATLIATNFDIVKKLYEQFAEEEIAYNEAHKGDKNFYKSTWRQDDLKRFNKTNKDNFVKKAAAYLQGTGSDKGFNRQYLSEILNTDKSFMAYPEYGLYHAILISIHPHYSWINWYEVFNTHSKPEYWQDVELRQLAYLLGKAGIEDPKRVIADGYLSHSLSEYINEPAKVYPFFVENIEYVQEAFGLLPSQADSHYYAFTPQQAITLLKQFPRLPKMFIAPLLELALGEQKTLRHDAQDLLASHLPNTVSLAIEALESGKQDIRITAIRWLTRLDDKSAIKPLYDLLKKEKKEVVIAEILTALEALGEDISKYLDPKALLKDAQKGLTAKLSSSLAWFDFDTLPTVYWQNGKEVHADIIKWWVVLAEKLKDPKPNALFVRYLELLDDKSQKALSLHLLQAFIAEDTKHPSLDEATALADKEGESRLKNYQYWYKQHPEYYTSYANATLESVKAEIIREHMAIYLGSAIKSKGILALSAKTQGATAVKIAQDFMKNHYTRRSQVEAMLSSFATSDDPLVIQLLLGISRRYKMASIQELAKRLVNEIAERNGWTADELADRTIPTAGFDDDGILRIDYGSRNLMAYIDDKDKFVLKNEDGKVIKALPTAKADDDKTAIKEAKALFSTAKKEYKQVLDLQSVRLYEAMCAERSWTSGDWQEYLATHPLMKRLIARLVWLEVDNDGNVIQSFRPAEDGALLNLDDDEITLQENSHIKVAHRVLLDDETAMAWREHFEDYKVAFLFEQMTRALPDLLSAPDHPEQACTDAEINTYKGYLTDTYTLRGVVTKMGYVRASIEDDGSFDSYYKPFDSVGLSAVISFSGSYVPEENLPAVVYGLYFEDTTVRSWNKPSKSLSEVPPVLLAECFADYHALAQKTQGYDKEWEKKTPW